MPDTTSQNQILYRERLAKLGRTVRLRTPTSKPRAPLEMTLGPFNEPNLETPVVLTRLVVTEMALQSDGSESVAMQLPPKAEEKPPVKVFNRRAGTFQGAQS